MSKASNNPEMEVRPPDEFLTAVGGKIKAARLRASLTLAQLGEKTGFVPSYLHTMERRGANLTLKNLAKIAECLQVGPRDLLPESNLDALTASGVASLVAALDRASEALSRRQSEEADLLRHMQSLVTLRAGLERLANEPPG